MPVTETYARVKTILVSQPKPERSPYYQLEEQYGLTIDWRPFIHVEGLNAKEFRKFKIYPEEYSAIIFTSLYSVDHFFRMCEEMRYRIPEDLKYFCLTEAIANYLQKFIIYRKRKVFFGTRTIMDLKNPLQKHRDKERFLLPCSNLAAPEVTNYLRENRFNFAEAMMYQTVSSDLSDLRDIFYDVLVFFSPLGIKSLFDNFPDFQQNKTRIAVFGDHTLKAAEDAGLYINIKAPTPEFVSMPMALGAYLKRSNPEGA